MLRNRGCSTCRGERIERGLDQIWQDPWLKDKWSLAAIMLAAIGLWLLWQVWR